MEFIKQHIERIILIFIGVLPVSTVALHTLDWVHIQVLLFPNIFLISVALTYLAVHKRFGQDLMKTWLMGICAVFLYDLSRIPFICCGWNDFIPGLGGWITGTQEDFFVGYLWRYLGNGAGLGLVFCAIKQMMKPKYIVLFGLFYGVSIFACLDIILLLSSHAQEMMFKVTPLSFIGGLTGHIVYGVSLGILSKHFLLEKLHLRKAAFQL